MGRKLPQNPLNEAASHIGSILTEVGNLVMEPYSTLQVQIKRIL